MRVPDDVFGPAAEAATEAAQRAEDARLGIAVDTAIERTHALSTAAALRYAASVVAQAPEQSDAVRLLLDEAAHVQGDEPVRAYDVHEATPEPE